MNVIIPLGLIFVFLCYVFRNNAKTVKYCFTGCFVIVASLLAIRYNFGEDYITYSALFDALQVRDVSEWEGGKMEFLYVKFLERLPSFETYIALQTILWFGLMYYFYIKNTDSTYLWLVLFFLFFNIAGIVTNMTALRTNVVSILLIPGFYLLARNTKKDRLFFIGVVVLSSFFHRSAIVLLPLALLSNNAQRKWVGKDKLIFLMLGIGLVSFVFKGMLTNFFAFTLIEQFPSFFEQYSYYLEDYENIKLGGLSTIIFLIQLYVLFYGLDSEKDKSHIVFIKIAIIFVLIELLIAAFLISRYTAILIPAYLVGFARSLRYVKKDFLVPVVVIVMLVSSWSFYQSITSRSNASIAVYHHIFQ